MDKNSLAAFKRRNDTHITREGIQLIQTWVPRYHKYSERSYQFPDRASLEQYFGKIADEHWDRVIEHLRNPQQERILRLHSSALLALLFFHNVSKDNTITIENIEYNKVDFEYKNRVFGHPSCVDVVLSNGKDVLFLECKFQEPAAYCGKEDKISIAYKPIYDSMAEFFEQNGLEYEGDSTLTIKQKAGKTTIYAQGIKQMISHWIGVLNGKAEEEDRDDFKDYHKSLGTIVYDFEGLKDVYGDYYENLSSHLKGVNVLPLLTYQEILKDNPNLISDKVKEFYSFE